MPLPTRPSSTLAAVGATGLADTIANELQGAGGKRIGEGAMSVCTNVGSWCAHQWLLKTLPSGAPSCCGAPALPAAMHQESVCQLSQGSLEARGGDCSGSAASALHTLAGGRDAGDGSLERSLARQGMEGVGWGAQGRGLADRGLGGGLGREREDVLQCGQGQGRGAGNIRLSTAGSRAVPASQVCK